MFKRMDLKKAALLLAVIFVATAAIASFIFFAQYGFDFNSDTMFSGDIKNGVKVDEEKTEVLQGLDNIKVETVSDDIYIIPYDSSEVKVHFYGTYLSSNPDFKPELTVDRSGGSLKIKVDYNKKNVFNFNSNLKLDVYIPKQYADKLEITSTSGEITADGLTLNSFISRTVSGNLDAKLINAKEAEIDTTSGETKINGAYDSFSFNSVSGNLVAADLTSKSTTLGSTSGEILVAGTPGDLKAETISGDLNLEYKAFSNIADIRATSGEVTIKLPESAGFTVDFSSSSGSAVCEFPVTVTADNNEGRKLKGTVGNGEGSIEVTTTSGNLLIKK